MPTWGTVLSYGALHTHRQLGATVAEGGSERRVEAAFSGQGYPGGWWASVRSGKTRDTEQVT